jgi:hypothetical protein
MKTVSTKKQAGVALVTTVIVIAVLAVVAVAFMQSTTSDRFSSRSVVNYTRAKLAADAGLAVASAILASNTTNDTFIVVANTNGQLFVGNGIRGSTNFSYAPLFSAASSLTNPVAPVVTSSNPSVSVANGFQTNLILPGGLSATSPNIAWTYLTDTNGAINARFAFWVEDLGGRLDLSVVGTDNEDVAKRPTGTNPAEIALWSLFPPIADSSGGDAAAQADQIVRARESGALLTAATSRLLQNSAVTADMLADLAVGLGHDTNEPEIIPFGLGYDADEGKPKVNLNANLSAAGGQRIAEAIQRNLPNFATQRAGGMAPGNYVNLVAANIVDYADANSTPAAVGSQAGNEPAVYLNEIFDRYLWSESIDEAGEWSVRIEITTYMEFWNPTDQNVQGALRVEVDATGLVVSVNGADQNLAAEPWLLEENVNFRPNEYQILEMSREVVLPWGPTRPPANATLPLPEAEVNYAVSLDNAQVDKSVAGSGLERTESTAGLRFNQPNWKGNAMVADSDLALGRVGDPRMNTLIAYQRRGHTYINRTSWGGRNLMRELADRTFGEVKKWHDGTFITNSPPGAEATTPTELPPALAAGVVYYSNAPVKFNNSGAFSNIVELGNVFDPIQWSVDLTGTDHISTGASANALSGGGNSLRIGRPEHPRFTNDGRRASQLLDLFTVGPTNASGVSFNRIPGRINLNTAGTNALRALVAGVYHRNDPALTPTANLVVPVNAVNAFVSAVQRFRTERPFLSTSQLALLATNSSATSWPSNAVFGNRALVGANEWNDSAAEEWFSRIYALSTTRSRNFMVYAVGQTVQPLNPTVPTSTVQSAYQLYVAPQRDPASGAITNTTVRLVNSWTL